MTARPWLGSRGDVSTGASYDTAGRLWTLEMKRSLTTSAGEAEDVQFDDLSASYVFGMAVFDNSAINHAIHTTVMRLEFRQ